MITTRGVDVRVGARLLLSDVTLHIAPGDRIGLVGRNGAGKTTLLATLAGQLPPAAGAVTHTGPVGHLPQDSRAADPAVTVTDRIMSARGLADAVRALRAAEEAMARADSPALERRAMDAYTRAEARFQSRGGYAAEAEAARVAAGLGLPTRVMDLPVGTLSGGQRRRVELARILFAEQGTLLLDEPTNHLDAGSVAWLRGFLAAHQGGLVLISHDLALLEHTVNRVFHLDPQRAAIDVHNTGWRAYLAQRAADERRRTRERANAERKAASLHAQADRMRANVATATSARSMARRADRMLAALEPVRQADRTARIRLPEPAPCGRMPLGAISLTKSYAGRPVLTGLDLAVDRGSRLVVLVLRQATFAPSRRPARTLAAPAESPSTSSTRASGRHAESTHRTPLLDGQRLPDAALGHNGAGKTTLLRILAGHETPDSGRVVPGPGLRLGYFAQEHDTLDPQHTVRDNLAQAAPHLGDGELRRVLGAFLFRGDDADKPASVLSGGERTRLALAGLVHCGANVLLLDEPTNNLDPASRTEVLAAVGSYPGAIVMVTHDPDAIASLRPDRVLLLPEGDEDLWQDSYLGLVSLARCPTNAPRKSARRRSGSETRMPHDERPARPGERPSGPPLPRPAFTGDLDPMTDSSLLGRFYDEFAPGYHLLYPDWDASLARQGAALDTLIRSHLGDRPAEVLDCACGIGTQAIGLAAQGHRVTGTDLSPIAAARATTEAARRGLRLPTAAADMRRLPFPEGRFDVVVCADNALPHLLTAEDVRAALAEMHRVLRPGGLLLVSTRPYDELRRSRPASTAPQTAEYDGRRSVIFQLWSWHEDGERYDLELFRLAPDETDTWQVSVGRSTYWALTSQQLTGFAEGCGFTGASWEQPEHTGFFQPLLIARTT
ncbi:ATP-binding cassette domain-containing protein [Kitasatospora sp. NPDC051170]|uniref:ATP-binding cassette domain-containing protein n=1 Tax=Kitasatospora sp. NPDC051170 TaxID=3364056 RepID=UPI003790415D